MKEDVELLREKLHKIVNIKDIELANNEVLEASKELDEALNCYNRRIKNEANM
jgi:Spo0E like sporulation regulatory protein.